MKLHVPPPTPAWRRDPLGEQVLVGVAWLALFAIGLAAVGVGSLF